MSVEKFYSNMDIGGNIKVSGNLMSILSVDPTANIHFPNEASLRMYSNPIGLRQYASCNVNSGGTFTNNYGINNVSRSGSVYTISYNPTFPNPPAISTTIFGVPTATQSNFYFVATI